MSEKGRKTRDAVHSCRFAGAAVGGAVVLAVLGVPAIPGCARAPAPGFPRPVGGVASGGTPALNRLSEQEAAAGFRLLFDGESLTGWRGFCEQGPALGWAVVAGELRGTGVGRDLMTIERFSDFELRFEFKIAPGGNSGVLYRVVEAEAEAYMSGPEYQILDEAGHLGIDPVQTTAANYGLDAPATKPRPAGVWNEGVIRIRNGAVEHWLNGVLAVAYVLGSPAWKEKVARSKFSAWPAFGMQGEGHIVLQAHGAPVAFRNIKIRPL